MTDHPTTEPLRYESREPVHLEPGEKVVWSYEPNDATTRGSWVIGGGIIGYALSLFLLIGGIVGSDERTIALGIIGLSACVLVTVFILRLRPSVAYAPVEVFYALTDRRIIRISRKPIAETDSVELRRVQLVSTDRRRGKLTVGGSLKIEHLPDPRDVASIVFEMAPKLGRRKRPVRRIAPHGSMSDQTSPSPQQLPPDVAELIMLRPGERVLWTDTPRPWPAIDGRWLRGRLRIVAWMLLPILVLFAGWRKSGSSREVPFLMMIGAGAWIFAALWALLITPVKQARGLARTRYVLTDARMISIEGPPPRAVVWSQLLYAVGQTTIALSADGSGDLLIGNRLLPHIPSIKSVQQQVIDAVYAAGGPSDAFEETDPLEPDEKQQDAK